MKIFPAPSWMPHCSGLLFALFASIATAQNSAGVEKFDPNNFPGFVMEEVVVPVPSEIFSVLDKLGEPNWKDEVNELIIPNTSNRTELSLIFGLIVAEGFVAVQAQDKQAIEDIGREVINVARKLGLEKPVSRHAKSITDAVQQDDWKGVRREFDQTQATVRAEMQRMKDSDLAQCVSLGGWLRGTASVTSVISKNYSADRSELLNQPNLVEHFINSVTRMPQTTKNNQLITAISQGLTKIRSDMNVPRGVFSLEKTNSIRKTSDDLLALILKTKAN
ncbi:hypothetical protein FEM03_22190 [Phragmitibacter flavus]|uniref:Uncharacterized protein n=1 Tax=Phragmitibacter flavus TaxID=2576071 RepID=A0A5R8K854_9BACT|nr:hypothetical protein [Phragmitibacter flavus]TLD68518.1 hypothetical protein FEM03_22190 [Phragmitibacter flavus]